MIFPEPKDLYDALKLKANIFDYPNINNYKKVLFMDVDIIVQNDIAKLFNDFKPKDGILYALHEQNGTHFTKFWSLLKYTREDIKNFYKKNIISFNVGTMLFGVTTKMRIHHENLKKFIKTTESPFYEQSLYNYYFNKAFAIDTDFFQNKVVIFPVSGAYYMHPTFVHFAGIGDYLNKTIQMTNYLKILLKNKHKLLIA
jgi:lipopolysaccharide biosynthesis glycosyltransferase